MRVARLSLHPLRGAFTGGGYRTSYGNRTHLDNLVLAIESDAGLVGHGEIAKITGASPEPGAPDRVDRYRGRLQALIGAEATPAALSAALGPVVAEDTNLACAVDVAAWDLLGKKSGLPVHDLMGGARVSAVPIYFTLGQTDPETTAKSVREAHGAGYGVFQFKVGTDPVVDRARIAAVLGVAPDGARVLFDANGGWSVETAIAIIRDFDTSAVLWEEPCATFEENRTVAERTGARIMLDQCMSSLSRYGQLAHDRFAAATGLKPTIQKGLTGARAARDLCVDAGIALKIDDSWGVDIGTSAALSLAVGVPAGLLVCAVDMRVNFETGCAEGGPTLSGAMLAPSAAPGLGLDVRPGDAIAVIG
jgi:L-alanine-DL-glutamate epimerase-like enolase superfamily enzyme